MTFQIARSTEWIKQLSIFEMNLIFLVLLAANISREIDLKISSDKIQNMAKNSKKIEG